MDDRRKRRALGHCRKSIQHRSHQLQLAPPSRNDAFLFASNQGSSSVSFLDSVAAGGSLASLGSFGSGASLHVWVGMATHRSAARSTRPHHTFGVAAFRIDAAGSLAQLGDEAIAGVGDFDAWRRSAAHGQQREPAA